MAGVSGMRRPNLGRQTGGGAFRRHNRESARESSDLAFDRPKTRHNQQ
jgi:hypothetical protein